MEATVRLLVRTESDIEKASRVWVMKSNHSAMSGLLMQAAILQHALHESLPEAATEAATQISAICLALAVREGAKLVTTGVDKPSA